MIDCIEPGLNGGLGLMLVSTIAGRGAGSGSDDPSGAGAGLFWSAPLSAGAGVDSFTPSGTRWDPSGCGITGFAFSGAGPGAGAGAGCGAFAGAGAGAGASCAWAGDTLSSAPLASTPTTIR